MASRLVHLCDYCKEEFDSEEIWNIKITKQGTKKAAVYEICTTCAEKLQTQLVSTKKPTLSIKSKEDLYNEEGLPLKTVLTDKDAKITALEEGENFFPDIHETRVGAMPEGGIQDPDKENCSHMNKSRPRMATIGGKQGFYRDCKECGAKIPLKTKSERDAINSINTSEEGISLRDHSLENRKRS